MHLGIWNAECKEFHFIIFGAVKLPQIPFHSPFTKKRNKLKRPAVWEAGRFGPPTTPGVRPISLAFWPSPQPAVVTFLRTEGSGRHMPRAWSTELHVAPSHMLPSSYKTRAEAALACPSPLHRLPPPPFSFLPRSSQFRSAKLWFSEFSLTMLHGRNLK